MQEGFVKNIRTARVFFYWKTDYIVPWVGWIREILSYNWHHTGSLLSLGRKQNASQDTDCKSLWSQSKFDGLTELNTADSVGSICGLVKDKRGRAYRLHYSRLWMTCCSFIPAPAGMRTKVQGTWHSLLCQGGGHYHLATSIILSNIHRTTMDLRRPSSVTILWAWLVAWSAQQVTCVWVAATCTHLRRDQSILVDYSSLLQRFVLQDFHWHKSLVTKVLCQLSHDRCLIFVTQLEQTLNWLTFSPMFIALCPVISIFRN